MPLVIWPNRRYVTVLSAAVIMLLVVLANLVDLRGAPPLPLLFVTAFLPQWLVGTRYVLASGVLIIAGNNWVPQYIPLAHAELTQGNGRWHLRWRDGKMNGSRPLKLPDYFAAALGRAIDSARSAELGTLPTSTLEARRLVAVGDSKPNLKMFVMGTAFCFALAIVSSFMGNPLIMLPLAVLPFWFAKVHSDWVLLLAGDHLWEMAPGQEPRPFPLDRITGVHVSNRIRYTIRTTDARHPEIKLNPYTTGEFVKLLKRKLTGQTPGPTKEVPTPVVARCTLCGRPEPSAAPSHLFICQTCSGKARYEATQAGHGPTAKEIKPL